MERVYSGKRGNVLNASREPVILSIAGTDPLGGAGCPADVATFRAFGWSGVAVETAWVTQNSRGVYGFSESNPDVFRARLRAVFEDCTLAAIKIGMIGSATIIHVLEEELSALEQCPPIVLDPVSASGSRQTRSSLYDGELRHAFDTLLPNVTLITPNANELLALTGVQARTHSEALEGANVLHARGVHAVLLKGGHLKPYGHDRVSIRNDQSYDVYVGKAWPVDIHGTGCHLSSAIASGLASGKTVHDATRAASTWLHRLVEREAYHYLGHGRPQFDARRLHEGFDAPKS